MNRTERFCCSSGTNMKQLYSPVLQDDGTILLVPSGKVDTDEAMNIEAEQCSLENILTRYANGDLDALNRFEGIYADVSDFPKTYAELLQHSINAENGFHRLPVDVQKKFDNNWRKWLIDYGSEEWFKAMNFIKDSVIEEVKDES